MKFMQRIGAIFALLLCVSPAVAQDHWVASWGAGSVKIGGEEIPASGVTYRNLVRISLGGKQVRLTLSNRFGTKPLTVGGVSVAESAGEGKQSSHPLQAVTFSGKQSVVIAAGSAIVSDPVNIEASPLGDFAVSIFLPQQKIAFYTGHPVSHQTNYRSPGNQLSVPAMPAATTIAPWRVLTAIDVLAPEHSAAIVAFGDSITDGTGTTDDKNLRWPNQLAARLQAYRKYAHLAVVNEGIGGNRILHGGGEPQARAGQHPSAVERWSYDALERSSAKFVILLEGVNDIGRSSLIREGSAGPMQEKFPEAPVTATDLIGAMSQLVDQAHARGIKVIGATLTPYGGARYERPDGQETRAAVNEFIRHGGKFDGVIDFERALQDPARPTYFRPEYNDKDHLHPNDAGARAMAESIDLSIFQ